jgi:signal transduction histidine kinase
MKNKLISKISRVYLIFSILILLVSIPLFYVILQHWLIEETDEKLHLLFDQFEVNAQKMNEEDLVNWNTFNKESEIHLNQKTRKERLFYKEEYGETDHELEPFRVFQKPIEIKGKSYLFVAKSSLLEKEDLVENLVNLFAILMLVFAIGILIISRLISKKMWKPFYSTLDKIENFQLDKNGVIDFSATKIEEFQRLNNSLSQLIERSKKVYLNQKEFIENAAHEMQTPLAVFQSKLENLSQEENLNTQQTQTINELRKTTTRLSKLNKNLLLLSRIENDQFKDEMVVNFNDIVKNHLEFYQEQANATAVEISFFESGTLTAKTNQTLTETLIHNLVLNAIKHNLPNGMIVIELSSDTFKVSNSGSIQIIDSDRLFERFYKSDSSKGGTGLGLSIVKRISNQNNWSITYDFQNQMHVFMLEID